MEATLGFGTSAPGIVISGRAVDAISKGEPVQFHQTADSRITNDTAGNRIKEIPIDTNEKDLQVELLNTDIEMLGVALQDAAIGEWLNICIYGPCRALCEGTTDINAGDTIRALASNGDFRSINASSDVETHGHALEDYTAAGAVLKWIFLDMIAKSINLAGNITRFTGGRVIGS